MALAAVAEDYFRSMNPLATKIHEDIVEARNSYENIWDTLSEKEKTEIINESLIKPEISLKYSLLDSLDFDINDPPVRKDDLMSFFGRDHGQRMVQDEYGSYRDEHSAPFLYQTKSQLNLCVLAEHKTPKDAQEVPNSPPVLTELALSHSKVVSELKFALRSQDIRNAQIAQLKKEEDSQRQPKLISKFIGSLGATKDSEYQRLVSPARDRSNDHLYSTYKTPPQEPKFEKHRQSVNMSSGDLSDETRGLLSSNGSSTDFQSTETLTDDVPKTGYDFLDNW